MDALTNDTNKPPSDFPKSSFLAAALNVVPGLGLAYLGKWRAALVNLLLAIALVLAFYYLGDETLQEHIHWVFLVVIVGSSAIAHAMANSMRSQ